MYVFSVSFLHLISHVLYYINNHRMLLFNILKKSARKMICWTASCTLYLTGDMTIFPDKFLWRIYLLPKLKRALQWPKVPLFHHFCNPGRFHICWSLSAMDYQHTYRHLECQQFDSHDLFQLEYISRLHFFLWYSYRPGGGLFLQGFPWLEQVNLCNIPDECHVQFDQLELQCDIYWNNERRV